MGGLLLAICINKEDHVPIFLPIGMSIMYKMKGESVDHVLVQYEIALSFWERLYLEAGLRSEIQVGIKSFIKYCKAYLLNLEKERRLNFSGVAAC